jgi:putative nucleotidyltransferase with HDIG domain
MAFPQEAAADAECSEARWMTCHTWPGYRQPGHRCNHRVPASTTVSFPGLAPWAQQLARVLLHEPLPRRWAHVQGVAARARGLAPVLGADSDLLEAAAWLHDIGYAPSLATTGLHQLDGARYLREAQHADAMLCRLVAHHSCAIIEAGERGLADVLSSEFDPAPYALSGPSFLPASTGSTSRGVLGVRHRDRNGLGDHLSLPGVAGGPTTSRLAR